MQYTSEANLSELLWLDLASHFALTLPIPYVQAVTITIYGVATALCEISFSGKILMTILLPEKLSVKRYTFVLVL